VTFTLAGRIQTRLLLSATLGVLWTAFVTPFLPQPPLQDMGMSGPMTRFMTPVPGTQPSVLGVDYRMTFGALGLMVALGVGWDLLWHMLQLSRREKDWPLLFSLLAVVPEGTLLWIALHATGLATSGLGSSSPDLPMFAADLGSTWLVMWLAMAGPIGVLLPRWRFGGGRVLHPWRPSASRATRVRAESGLRSGPDGVGPDRAGPGGPGAPDGPDGIGPDGIGPDGIGPDGIGPGSPRGQTSHVRVG